MEPKYVMMAVIYVFLVQVVVWSFTAVGSNLEFDVSATPLEVAGTSVPESSSDVGQAPWDIFFYVLGTVGGMFYMVGSIVFFNVGAFQLGTVMPDWFYMIALFMVAPVYIYFIIKLIPIVISIGNFVIRIVDTILPFPW